MAPNSFLESHEVDANDARLLKNMVIFAAHTSKQPMTSCGHENATLDL